MDITKTIKHRLEVLGTLLAILVLPLIGTAQTFDTLPIEKTNHQIIDKKINLPSGQSGFQLEKVRKLIPNNNDSKKLDSLFMKMARGGDMSGGGSTLLFNNQRLFLDLFEEKYKQDLSSCFMILSRV